MEYDTLKQKVDLIIKGLEAQGDIESVQEFVRLLDEFTFRQMDKCRRTLIERDLKRN